MDNFSFFLSFETEKLKWLNIHITLIHTPKPVKTPFSFSSSFFPPPFSPQILSSIFMSNSEAEYLGYSQCHEKNR